MATIPFVLNLAMALFALALCAWHAGRDRERLTFLAVAIVYGVILEQLVIIGFEAYHYNVSDFLLTVGDVPVVIGFGWAAIIYSGFEIADALAVRRRVRPAFVALFALHIDLAIDAVAIRVPFWSWTPPGVWFGVPLGNFLGWFLVASLFTASWLLLRRRTDVVPLVGVGTMVASLAALVLVLEVWTRVATTLPVKIAIFGPLVLASIVVVLRDGLPAGRLDGRIAAIPLLYHGYYLGLLLWFGMYRAQPLMLVVSLAMIGVGLAIHRDARELPSKA